MAVQPNGQDYLAIRAGSWRIQFDSTLLALFMLICSGKRLKKKKRIRAFFGGGRGEENNQYVDFWKLNQKPGLCPIHLNFLSIYWYICDEIFVFMSWDKFPTFPPPLPPPRILFRIRFQVLTPWTRLTDSPSHVCFLTISQSCCSDLEDFPSSARLSPEESVWQRLAIQKSICSPTFPSLSCG